MTEELEIFAWMLLAGFLVAALAFAWSQRQARRPGKRARPLRIRETDPDDAYTC